MDINVRIIANELGIRNRIRAIVNLGGDISFKLTQFVDYADDVALLARSLKALNL